jgi:GDP-4-dehydro-6-deoxy-D-mannose reductase
VGSGKAVAISDALAMICGLSTADIAVERDAERMRPSDTPVMEADISRLQALTGWEPEIPLETTLSDMLCDWRGKTAGRLK